MKPEKPLRSYRVVRDLTGRGKWAIECSLDDKVIGTITNEGFQTKKEAQAEIYRAYANMAGKTNR
jgi:hypothetical protein